jgi:hypothetical protein
VRQVFEWVGRERLSLGEVCRRLTQARDVTRPGKTVWERRVVWGILHNPAYTGAAAFGKTRYESPCARGDGRSATAPASPGVPSLSGMCPPTSGSPLRSRDWGRRSCVPRSKRHSRRTNATRATRAVVRGTCCKAEGRATSVALPCTGSR